MKDRPLNVVVSRNARGHYVIHSQRRWKAPYWVYTSAVYSNYAAARAQADLFRAPNGSRLFKPDDWRQVPYTQSAA